MKPLTILFDWVVKQKETDDSANQDTLAKLKKRFYKTTSTIDTVDYNRES
jgi:hypothetical protein